ncbi:sodium-coupled monocarboxylate transporter 2-like [Dermacentor silvarum]|uniref:sodium-coupled monocarboxylate transporter 2-like n=1 Tax=Dermacentor silvarum TaxID=543639 RepID=UPI002101A383|nr:sodium-coupled monocarboxylate transporter 2-like [Dermacentor silvarum]
MEDSIVEYGVFGSLMALNFGLGLYFSLRRKARLARTTVEVFLGSRALRALPLAASVVATIVSSAGMVGFTGHFYAYGFHLMWHALVAVVVAPVAAHIFLPVMYGLRITSVFEYIRQRFNSAIALTACISYIFLTQSIGALAIFAAGLTIFTVFGAPLVLCNILIGLFGTLYTALGGLRGVVWTDCAQLIFMLFAPATVIAKVIIDMNASYGTFQPVTDFDLRAFVGNFTLDFSHDETVWAAFFGSVATAIYRVGLDQAVVQRCMASRTLAEAQRMIQVGTFLLVTAYAVQLSMSLAIIFWFRGCDPQLRGAIASHDQILPFYVRTHLVKLSGFSGIFLASIVSAASSTTSSIVNSQAAVLYVDILSRHFKNPETNVRWITRGVAFLLGAVMTSYSCVIVYMGSVTRLLMMAYGAATGPFVGLFILAIVFPFVHSKGAGISTLLMIAAQVVALWRSIDGGIKPPHMPVSLHYCPDNTTFTSYGTNLTVDISSNRSQRNAASVALSPLWSSLLGTLGTVLLGILISVITGEHRKRHAEVSHLNRWCVRFWRRMGVMEPDESFSMMNTEDTKDEPQTTKTLLPSQSEDQQESTV